MSFGDGVVNSGFLSRRFLNHIAGGHDPFFYLNLLLLNFEQAVGSSLFVDLSIWHHFRSASTNVISAAQAKFGTRSLATGVGVSSWAIATGTNNEWYLAAQDWTAECFIFPTTIDATTRSFIGFYIQAGSVRLWDVRVDTTNGLQGFVALDDGTTFSINSGAAVLPTLNAWNHVHLTRKGDALSLGLNGAQVASAAGLAARVLKTSATTTQFRLGTVLGSGLPGFLDEVRLTKGVARYTPGAPYRVPTQEFYAF